MKKSRLVPRIISILVTVFCLFFFLTSVSHSLDKLVKEFVRIILIVSSSVYRFLEENHLGIGLFYFTIGLWVLYLLVQKFNFVVSGYSRFKPYFTSRYNILTSKIRRVHEIDLPKELLFKKLIEIMPHVGFIIKHSDEQRGTIHAVTPITKIVMGEIIYISLTEVNGKSMLEFYSTSISPGFDFKYILRERNERNFKKFLQEYEESLII
jgi:hypothetical protein